ncbi:hypothetical protein STCU_05183 [Strigomonas culicis]|uniref:Uncharacterized protein n=1 Tax=Strigomonas culicis TaxID=28005 RepID=S9UHW9_9TRYP|nr:hypothetical protein STCU_05183 [Strigomonas culicis]|eukprot:EPY28334.1 hypothetical protein STCU_05183 [Strigomonas culicis]
MYQFSLCFFFSFSFRNVVMNTTGKRSKENVLHFSSSTCFSPFRYLYSSHFLFFFFFFGSCSTEQLHRCSLFNAPPSSTEIMFRHSFATTAVRRVAAPTMLTARRHFTDKLVVGASAATLTCTSTLGVFHLIVTPVSASIAIATIGCAAASGAAVIIDGGKESSGSTFGAVVGAFIGAMGGFYAKSQSEPWRK